MARVKTHPGRMLRAVRAETAVRFGRYLGTGPACWMNLQSGYEISVVESTKGRMIEDEVPVATVVS